MARERIEDLGVLAEKLDMIQADVHEMANRLHKWKHSDDDSEAAQELDSVRVWASNLLGEIDVCSLIASHGREYDD